MKFEEFAIKYLALVCVTLIQRKCAAIDIDDINLSNCTNDSPCEDFTSNPSPFTRGINDPTENSSEGETSTLATDRVTDVNSAIPIAQTTLKPVTTTEITGTTTEITGTTTEITGTTVRNDAEEKIGSIEKNISNVCACNIKISSCDINCCCDVDCNEFQLSVFSHCDNHRPKMYDSRYCYTKNFIQRNNTEFILERLASNLFCIAYDNLPPIYGTSDVPTLRNRQAFERAKYSIGRKKYTWDRSNSIIPPEFNISNHYRDTDHLWIFRDKFVKLMELPQSGLTGRCTFRKVLKYLESSRWTCVQSDLSNENSYLFGKSHNDFQVISSPHLFDSSYVASTNRTCPNNICISLRSLYCFESSEPCNVTKPLEQSCSNGKCRNVVKKIRYTIVHNGTSGIESVEARFVLADVAQSFYQHFEVIYEWSSDERGKKMYRSGNPGYTIGNPIVIGSLASVTTNDGTNEYVNVNGSNYHLTLPLSGKDGNCAKRERYPIGFGENVKLRCNVEVTVNKFSPSVACINLQNKTLKFMLEDSLGNDTGIVGYKTFVSKTGDLLPNDTSSWTKILLDKIPRNVVTGQIFNDKIRCSALVTTMRVEILHTILPNHEESESHKVVGVALTFEEPADFTWTKCLDENCTDVINVELMSYVTFTDISTPSMYYYAGGPNLDITLPYDFFYPFMSSVAEREPLNALLVASVFLLNI